ncbi:MAG: helicase-exonuclease AddAB subunit AddA [Bacillota bacterium]|nr:MAG: helicase-exonuclease AddAB subunit AddA [Bacillota bacterium]
MSGVRWTPAQQRALTTRGRHLLVSAAAGSGKTAVLVERIVRRITEEGGDIDGLLVVTFTDAAATQMRDRIREAVEERLAARPGDTHLSRQLLLLPRADIGTLHSFCLDVVRRHFYALGLDPNVRVMDEHEAHLTRLEALDLVLEEAYDRMDEDRPFARLVDGYAGQGGDQALQRLMLALHDYARSLPDPAGWLREAGRAYQRLDEATFDETPWARELQLHARVVIGRAIRLLERALSLACGPGGAAAHAETIEADIQRLEGLREAAGRSWSALAAAAEAALFPGAKRAAKDDGDPDVRTATLELRNKAKRLMQQLYDRLLSRPLAEQLAALRDLAPVAASLVEHVVRLDEAYAEIKAARGVIDFGDIEHFCLKLLDDQAVAEQIRSRYDEVLVDECQDLNGVQDEILRRIVRPPQQGGELFMVGDVKQSIYRFRQADPGLFLERYRRASPEEDAPEQRIDLRENFRSRRAIVDAVNFIFRQIMTPGAAEMAYGPEAELVFGASFGPPDPGTGRGGDVPVEVHLLEKSGAAGAAPGEPDAGGAEAEAAGAADDLLADMSSFQREAVLVARRIQQLVRGGEAVVWDRAAGRYRPARYGDIVILLRTVRHRANELIDVLARMDVPAYAELGTGYFAAAEVETMMALLAVLDNPRQDIELAAVLRSPMVGCSVDDLARIRLCRPDGDFFDAVVAAAAAPELGELQSRLAAFLGFLEQARTDARRMPLSRLVWRLLQQTGYFDYVGAMPGGRQRQANLRALHERARQFDTFARHGLARFLRFIERLREADGDLGTAPAAGEGEDVVRVMSVHKSKGLQFPIVFVVGCGRSFQDRPVHPDAAFQQHLGVGLRIVDPERRLSEPSLLHAAARARRRREELAEEMRLLYVALTRAQERLILVGADDLEAKAPGWATDRPAHVWPLPDEDLLAAGSWLDWLAPAWMRHPGAAALRELAGGDGPPLLEGDPSRWDFRVWTADDLQEAADDEGAGTGVRVSWPKVAALRPLAEAAGQEGAGRLASDDAGFAPVREELERRLAWRYDWAPVVGRPAKQGVSELKRRWDDADRDEKAPVVKPVIQLEERPAFLQETAPALTPAERGSAVHLVMQHLDLAGPLAAGDIARQIAAMVERRMLTPEQAAAVDVAPIARFFETPLGLRLRSGASRVRREVPFIMALPALEAYPDLAADADAARDEIVVVQGIIDVLLRDGHSVLIVDYKTDHVSAAAAPLRARAYRSQVALYRRAVREIYGVGEVEAHLVFLTPGVAVPVPDGE